MQIDNLVKSDPEYCLWHRNQKMLIFIYRFKSDRVTAFINLAKSSHGK